MKNNSYVSSRGAEVVSMDALTQPPPKNEDSEAPDLLHAIQDRGFDSMTEFNLLLNYATAHDLRVAANYAAVLAVVAERRAA